MTSKAAKVWRRTRVGGGLALLLALLLWIASRSETGHVILFTGWAVGLAAVWEVTRMGGLARRGLAIVLLPAHGLVLVETLQHGASPESVHVAETLLLVVVFTFLLEGGRRLGRRWTGAPPLPETGPWARGLPAVLAAPVLALWLCVPMPWLWLVWGGWGTAGLVALDRALQGRRHRGLLRRQRDRQDPSLPGHQPGEDHGGVRGVAGGRGRWSERLLAAAGSLLPTGASAWVGGALAGGTVNLAAQAGDLAESWLKRRTGVKDSGTLFGPSGGFLDLVDSLLLSVPAALATWPWIFSV